MKILWTLPYSPWPTVGGNRVRVYNLLRKLSARGHRITLVIQTDSDFEDARLKLEPLVERLIVIWRRRRLHVTLFAAFFSPYPVDVSINAFRPHAPGDGGGARGTWDIVQVEHSYGLQSFLPVLERLDQPFVMTEHNVESTLVHTNQYHPRVPKAVLAAMHRYDLWRYRRWERRAFAAPRRLIAVTQPDAVRMSSIGGRPVDVVANGADTEAGAAVHPARDRPNIMFIGNFAYPPNQDAVEWAAAEIMPRIWRVIPAARFIVCGGSGRPEWPVRWPDPRIEWRGFVQDISAVQRECALFLAPLRTGGGSKLKVLEAMAAGLPVVSTQEGVSGLAAVPEQEYVPGEDSDSLAAAVIELLNAPKELERIGEAGRCYVQSTHGWTALAEKLERVYTDAMAPGAARSVILKKWRPHGDSNPGSHRERVVS